MDIDDVVVKIRNKNEKLTEKSFESLAPQAIARAVLETLERQEPVTLDDIIATMQGWLGEKPGDGAADIAITTVIRHLESLRAQSRSD